MPVQEETNIPETTTETTAPTTTLGTLLTTSISETTPTFSTSKDTTTTTTELTTTITQPQFASDEMLCKWAEKDYLSKTKKPAVAFVKDKTGNMLTIELIDSDGKVLDTYIIDVQTGTGTDSANKPVDLPQTGRNDPTECSLVFGAFILLGCGMLTVYAACRRKVSVKY